MVIDLVIKQAANGKFDAQCFDVTNGENTGVSVKQGDFDKMVDLYRVLKAVVPLSPVRIKFESLN